jgi:uncharacterized protein (TIGR03083 family)
MIHVVEIARSSSRIAELITEENWNLIVPSCPEWTLLDLVTHIGEVQNFWSHSIREANTYEPWHGEGSKPVSVQEAAKWLRVQTKSLIDAIESTADTSPCWTWWKDPQTARAVTRHQVQEAEIHRWDAELTVTTPSPIPLEIATDGIPEFLHAHRFAVQKLELPHIRLVASDANDSWHLHESAAGTVDITGTASDLVLFLTGRYPIEKLAVVGDSVGLTSLIEALPEINI